MRSLRKDLQRRDERLQAIIQQLQEVTEGQGDPIQLAQDAIDLVVADQEIIRSLTRELENE